jgi:predicted nucleic acid-binding protein
MIFVDTGAFVGKYVENDHYHAAAVAFWDDLARQSHPSVTTSFVLAEALTLIGRRTTHHFAAERARLIYASTALKVIRPTLEDELHAVLLFEKFADRSTSFVDCVSFAVMKRIGVSDAFSFDDHFKVAGFTVRP